MVIARFARIVAVVLALFASVAVTADTLPRWDAVDGAAYDVEERRTIGERHLRERDDAAEAVAWYRSAAEAGSAPARAYMGWFYEQGVGVAADGERAAHWYGEAVAAGAARYSLHLGWMYLEGRQVERDRAAAEAWFRRAIDEGVAEGRLALGSVYYADAVGGDPGAGAEAETLLLGALEEGVLTASRFLGRMYLEGIGVEPDPGRGLAAVNLGAESGDPEMQAYLAKLYLDGDVVAGDRVRAGKWAKLAAEAGDAQGQRLWQGLQEALDDETLGRARVQAAQWSQRGARAEPSPVPDDG